MKLILIVVCSLLLVGCGIDELPTERVCDPPLIDAGDRCCLDENDNQVCDMDEIPAEGKGLGNAEAGRSDEAAVKSTVPVGTSSKEQGQSQAIPHSAAASSLQELADELVLEHLDLSALGKRETVILFDSERTTGSMVAAVLNLQFYFASQRVGFADNAAIDRMSQSDIERWFQGDLLLLGNGCNNDLILEMKGLSRSGCDAGLVKGQAVIESYLREGRAVVLMMAADDEDMYNLVKRIAEGSLEEGKARVEVTLS